MFRTNLLKFLKNFSFEFQYKFPSVGRRTGLRAAAAGEGKCD